MQQLHKITCTNSSSSGVLQDHAGARPANLLPGQKAARLRQLLGGDTCVQVSVCPTRRRPSDARLACATCTQCMATTSIAWTLQSHSVEWCRDRPFTSI